MRWFPIKTGLLASLVVLSLFITNPSNALQTGPLVKDSARALSNCSKTYTRAMFHRAARKVYRHGNATVTRSERRKVLAKIRCQRYASSKPNVRRHFRRYVRAHARRFYWEVQRQRVAGTLRAISYIAACESGGNPRAISSGGHYRGKWQFDYGTWASVGGSGDPAAASEAEQDVRAVSLYRQRGTQPWPVCG